MENSRIDDFLKAIIKVYDRYGLAISHEDGQGAFQIYKDDPQLRSWLMAARDCVTKHK